MKIKTTPYSDYENFLPQKGQFILAQYSNETIFVYQAFNPRIAAYAVEHQQFGGEHYRFGRMSWIKPNFLWMMYRCGWGTKEAQKRVLAIEITKENFEKILGQAVPSSMNKKLYKSQKDWKSALASSSVRLQWDPDHHPYGDKLERRAIQLGLRGQMLRDFATKWILSIQDITEFVLQQEKKVKSGDLNDLLVIEEQVYELQCKENGKYLGLSSSE